MVSPLVSVSVSVLVSVILRTRTFHGVLCFSCVSASSLPLLASLMRSLARASVICAYRKRFIPRRANTSAWQSRSLAPLVSSCAISTLERNLVPAARDTTRSMGGSCLASRATTAASTVWPRSGSWSGRDARAASYARIAAHATLSANAHEDVRRAVCSALRPRFGGPSGAMPEGPCGGECRHGLPRLTFFGG